MTTTNNKTHRPSNNDADEALDDAAQGMAPTSADDDDDDEIDAIGHAAGITEREALADDGPVARRDAQRWELDPASAEDLSSRDETTRPISTAATSNRRAAGSR